MMLHCNTLERANTRNKRIGIYMYTIYYIGLDFSKFTVTGQTLKGIDFGLCISVCIVVWELSGFCLLARSKQPPIDSSVTVLLVLMINIWFRWKRL